MCLSTSSRARRATRVRQPKKSWILWGTEHMAFSQAQITALQRADRAAIRRCMSRIEQYWIDSRWLATRNRYRSDCVNQIDRDAPTAQVWTPTHVHLSDYIAASTVTHCFDGWAYLGRALDAELSGDRNPIHLDREQAILAGHPDVICHGMLSMTDIGSWLTHAMPDWQLESLTCRFVAPMAVGTRLQVVDACVEGLQGDETLRASVDFTAEDAGGVVRVKGHADFRRPSAAGH